MEEKTEGMGNSDALQSDASAVQAGSRKRRVDEDFKTAVCIASMSSKKAKTVGAMVKATGDFATTTAFGWIGPHMTEYRCETLITFGKSKTVSLDFEASRVGAPKGETLAIAIFDCDRMRGAWLPPQVCECASQTHVYISVCLFAL